MHPPNEIMKGHHEDRAIYWASVRAGSIAYYSKQVFMVQTPGIITSNETQWRHPKYILSTGATTLLVSFLPSDAGITSEIKQNEWIELLKIGCENSLSVQRRKQKQSKKLREGKGDHFCFSCSEIAPWKSRFPAHRECVGQHRHLVGIRESAATKCSCFGTHGEGSGRAPRPGKTSSESPGQTHTTESLGSLSPPSPPSADNISLWTSRRSVWTDFQGWSSLCHTLTY